MARPRPLAQDDGVRMNTAADAMAHSLSDGDDLLVGLRTARVFEGLSLDQLERLRFASKVRRHAAGHTLLRSGDAPAGLYVVVEGEYAVMPDDPDSGPLEVFSRGECFGECAMVDQAPTPRCVVATHPSTLIEISATRLRCTLRDDHALASRLYQNLLRVVVARLRAAQGVSPHALRPVL